MNKLVPNIESYVERMEASLGREAELTPEQALDLFGDGVLSMVLGLFGLEGGNRAQSMAALAELANDQKLLRTRAEVAEGQARALYDALGKLLHDIRSKASWAHHHAQTGKPMEDWKVKVVSEGIQKVDDQVAPVYTRASKAGVWRFEPPKEVG